MDPSLLSQVRPTRVKHRNTPEVRESVLKSIQFPQFVAIDAKSSAIKESQWARNCLVDHEQLAKYSEASRIGFDLKSR
jgi:hypothetical protein